MYFICFNCIILARTQKKKTKKCKKTFLLPPSENVTISPAPPSLNTQAGGRLLEKLHSVLEHLEGGSALIYTLGGGAGGDSLWAVNFEVQKNIRTSNQKKKEEQSGWGGDHPQPPPPGSSTLK